MTKKYGKINCSRSVESPAEHGDLRKGGSFEGYAMSTEAEARVVESTGEFLKAEGSRGWRGTE